MTVKSETTGPSEKEKTITPHPFNGPIGCDEPDAVLLHEEFFFVVRVVQPVQHSVNIDHVHEPKLVGVGTAYLGEGLRFCFLAEID